MRSLRREVSLIIAGSCILYTISGCAKAPDAELAATKAAVQAAKDAGADQFMARNFENLQKGLQMAEEEISNQNTSFFLTRKYTRAKDLLKKTSELATDITKEVPKIKEEAVKQVTENLGMVKGMLAATAEDIKKASRNKDKKSVIEELKANLNSADSAAAVAATEFAAGQVMKASESLSTVQTLIKKITSTLKPPSDEPQI
jgi:hypothetical protein